MQPVSASQIKTANACLRKWGWEKLAGKKPPPSPAMIRGTRLHACAEGYLKGEDVTGHPDWPLVRLAAPYLPTPKVDFVITEQRFDVELQGIKYTGFIDFQTKTYFGDHKTTSDFGYALSPFDLWEDPQYLLYSTVLGGRDADWIYYRTKGTPAVQAIHVCWDTHLEKAFNTHVHTTAERLHVIRQKGLTVQQLPPTLSECRAYGGCPHRAYCKPEEFKMSDDIMSLFGKAKAALETPPSIDKKVEKVVDFIKNGDLTYREGKAVLEAEAPLPPPVATDRINPPEAFAPQTGPLPGDLFGKDKVAADEAKPTNNGAFSLPPFLKESAKAALTADKPSLSYSCAIEGMIKIITAGDVEFSRRAFAALRPIVIEMLSE